MVDFPPTSMRKAFMRFAEKLSAYTRTYTCGEVHVRLRLDPLCMLEPELEAIEAVYPVVQENHQRQLDRVERLSQVSSNTAADGRLLLRIRSCKGLKEGGDSDRRPDPFVVAQFMEILDDGREGRMLRSCKTTRKSSTSDPSWEETFTVNEVPPRQLARLRLTVWEHDLSGIGNAWCGQVEVALDRTLPLDAVEMPLQPLLDKQGRVTKTAAGSISFTLRAKGRRREKSRGRLQSIMALVSHAQNVYDNEGEFVSNTAGQEQMGAAMKARARFLRLAVDRLNRWPSLPCALRLA